MKIKLLGIDLAKNVFQICALNQANKVLFNRSVRRAQFRSTIAKLEPTTIATTLSHRYDQYRLWFKAEKHIGWDALFIVENKRHQERAERYRPLFDKMGPQPVEIRILRNGRLAQKLEVYKYFGFKGKYEE